MDKCFSLMGAFFAFFGVAFGAFGGHALKARLTPDLLNAYEVGVRYQFYHALGLFAIAWATTHYASSMIPAAGWTMAAGLFIFSGSLYMLSFSGVKFWGALTPIGGMLLLISWGLLFWGILQN